MSKNPMSRSQHTKTVDEEKFSFGYEYRGNECKMYFEGGKHGF